MWYSRVVANLDAIPDFIAHYEREITDAKKDCRIAGIVEKKRSAESISKSIWKAMPVRSLVATQKSMWMAKMK